MQDKFFPPSAATPATTATTPTTKITPTASLCSSEITIGNFVLFGFGQINIFCSAYYDKSGLELL